MPPPAILAHSRESTSFCPTTRNYVQTPQKPQSLPPAWAGAWRSCWIFSTWISVPPLPVLRPETPAASGARSLLFSPGSRDGTAGEKLSQGDWVSGGSQSGGLDQTLWIPALPHSLWVGPGCPRTCPDAQVRSAQNLAGPRRRNWGGGGGAVRMEMGFQLAVCRQLLGSLSHPLPV